MLHTLGSVQYFAYRSRGAPWPLWRSVSVGDRSVAAYPAGPELQDSPSAGSPSAQTVPSASCSACRDTQETGISGESLSIDSTVSTNTKTVFIPFPLFLHSK